MVALFALAILSLLTTRALQNLQTNERREREEELLFVGQAYMNAIAAFYEQSPGTLKRYPENLQALLLDTRAVRTRRPLRRLYLDPIGASADWGVVTMPDGGITGVYSLSKKAPIKVDNFPAQFSTFAGAKSYQEWKFIYVPR